MSKQLEYDKQGKGGHLTAKDLGNIALQSGRPIADDIWKDNKKYFDQFVKEKTESAPPFLVWGLRKTGVLQADAGVSTVSQVIESEIRFISGQSAQPYNFQYHRIETNFGVDLLTPKMTFGGKLGRNFGWEFHGQTKYPIGANPATHFKPDSSKWPYDFGVNVFYFR